MDGTVVVENNTSVQKLFDDIMAVDTKRKHITIRNKYAVGIGRKFREILIYDYDRSSRPLVKVKKAGQTVLLRLGFVIEEALEILQNLLRIMQAVVTKEEGPKETPVHYPKVLPLTEARDTVGINKDGKTLMMNNTQFKNQGCTAKIISK